MGTAFVDIAVSGLFFVVFLYATGDSLAATAPVFIGVERNPYGTVASVLKHRGVRSWMANWQRHPIPNPFLGITREIAPAYGAMSMVQRSALRWQAHHTQMMGLSQRLPDRVHILRLCGG